MRALAEEMGEEMGGRWLRLRTDPWHFVQRTIAIVRARISLRRAALGPGVGANGRLDARLEGSCEIGPRVTFRGGMIPTSLRVASGASLSIGEGSTFNYGACVDVNERVEIGARCMVASMVRITDRDGDRAGPITIGDDVWIAHGALIQPAITIGDGAVISAGSVVTTDVPPRHLAAGNPAHSAPLSLVSREEAAPRAVAGAKG